MARSFGDIGSAIFNFFGATDEEQNSVSLNTKYGSTSLSCSRTTDSETDKGANTSLTLTQDAKRSLISSLSLIVSAEDKPSLYLETDAMSKQNISANMNACDGEFTVNLNWNDQKKYDVDLSVDTFLTSKYEQGINALNLSVSYDALLSNKLVIGGNIGVDVNEQSQSYNVGAEYKHDKKLLVGVKSKDNLRAVDVGLMYDGVRDSKFAMFGQASYPSFDYCVGVRCDIDSQSNVGVMYKPKERLANIRYNMDRSNVSGYVGANLSLDDGVKVQYGISITY